MCHLTFVWLNHSSMSIYLDFTSTHKLEPHLQEILEAREKEKQHIWTFRTQEEASHHWKELYGHLDEAN